ncbi:MAG: hypothetical protein OXC19_25340 [Bryobacterales bacterium]|nr:hypothetical protein [Bryobacterales bacterium]
MKHRARSSLAIGTAGAEQDAPQRPERLAAEVRWHGHGVGAMRAGVNCPVDNEGDFYPDEGGCLEALNRTFHLSGHKMALWELDHWRPWDDEIGTISFPILASPTDDTTCDVHSCEGDRIGSYRPRSSGIRGVSASADVQVTGAAFIDKYGVCSGLTAEECDH